MEPIMTLRNVGFRYGSDWAVRDVTLDISAGELLGILGPNGSGKSTLLKIMDGILLPQEGETRLGNHNISALGRTELAKKVAFVAQETSFKFSFSALEVVLMGRFPHLGRWRFEGKRDLDIVCHCLETVHALELADRSIHELSGGEKQRVLVARALAQEPDMILLDEPTSFLDIKFKKEIFELISSLARDKKITVVVVSHDIDFASMYCHRLLILKAGRMFKAGPPGEIITTRNIETVYDCPVLVDRSPTTGTPRVNVIGERRSQDREGRTQEDLCSKSS
jgi:iron complex transport system ATP-binding protein